MVFGQSYNSSVNGWRNTQSTKEDVHKRTQLPGNISYEAEAPIASYAASTLSDGHKYMPQDALTNEARDTQRLDMRSTLITPQNKLPPIDHGEPTARKLPSLSNALQAPLIYEPFRYSHNRAAPEMSPMGHGISMTSTWPPQTDKTHNTAHMRIPEMRNGGHSQNHNDTANFPYYRNTYTQIQPRVDTQTPNPITYRPIGLEIDQRLQFRPQYRSVQQNKFLNPLGIHQQNYYQPIANSAHGVTDVIACGTCGQRHSYKKKCPSIAHSGGKIAVTRRPSDMTKTPGQSKIFPLPQHVLEQRRRSGYCSRGAVAGSGWNCRSCNTDVTPMKRKGPDGLKTLCNACGLAWMQGKIYRDRPPNIRSPIEDGVPNDHDASSLNNAYRLSLQGSTSSNKGSTEKVRAATLRAQILTALERKSADERVPILRKISNFIAANYASSMHNDEVTNEIEVDLALLTSEPLKSVLDIIEQS